MSSRSCSRVLLVISASPPVLFLLLRTWPFCFWGSALVFLCFDDFECLAVCEVSFYPVQCLGGVLEEEQATVAAFKTCPSFELPSRLVEEGIMRCHGRGGVLDGLGLWHSSSFLLSEGCL